MKKFILLMALAWAWAAADAQAIYYVKKSGSDSNSCAQAQTEATPKITINSALNCLNGSTGAGAGQIVEVYVGAYAESLNNMPSGTSWSNPFTLRAAAGNVVTIRVGSGSSNIVFASAIDYYTIVKDLKCDSALITDQCIAVGPSGIATGRVRLQNLELINTETGIGIFVYRGAHHIEILGGSIHGGAFTCPPAQCGGGGVYTYPIYMEGSDNLIDGIKIYDAPSYGIHIYSGYSGLRPNRNIVRNTEIYNVGTAVPSAAGILVGGGGGDANQVYGNKVRNNGSHGISIAGSNTVVFNNTIYGNAESGLNWTHNSGAVARSNIIWGNGYDFLESFPPEPTRSNNLCMAAATGCLVVSDPLFIDSASGNLAITASSPAIGQGLAAVASGITACSNGAVDIGAHQTVKVSQAEVGTINSTTVAINLQNNCTPDILPASAITGLTIQEDTGGGYASKTISGVTSAAGSNQVRAVVTAGFTGGSSARFSYSTSTGNITDSALIGGAASQRLNAVTNFTITNNVSGGGGMTFTVVNLQALEHSCGQICTRVLSSNLVKAGGFSVPLRGKFLLREGIKCTGGDCPVQSHAIWYGKNGAANTQIPTQTTGQEDLSVCPAPNVQNGQATTQQITTGTFVAGQVRTIGSGAPSVDLAVNEVTENVRSLCIGPNVLATDTFTIQIRDSGGTAITNTAVAVVATQSPSRAKLEIGCDGAFREMAGGFECVPAGAANLGDVEISMAPHLESYTTRRKTDTSNAVRIEVPQSAVVRVNGAVQ